LIFCLDSVGGISNGDQQVGPLKKRRMARESMSDCPSPTVSGSGHMNFAEDDVIMEDDEVEQASRNISSIDSQLVLFKVNNTFSSISKLNNYLSNIFYFILFRIRVYH